MGPMDSVVAGLTYAAQQIPKVANVYFYKVVPISIYGALLYTLVDNFKDYPMNTTMAATIAKVSTILINGTIETFSKPPYSLSIIQTFMFGSFATGVLSAATLLFAKIEENKPNSGLAAFAGAGAMIYSCFLISVIFINIVAKGNKLSGS